MSHQHLSGIHLDDFAPKDVKAQLAIDLLNLIMARNFGAHDTTTDV